MPLLSRLSDKFGIIFSGAAEVSVTGGVVSQVGAYKVHAFLDTGSGYTLVVQGAPAEFKIDTLVVGGGGAGGSGNAGAYEAGGGGAGGFRQVEDIPLGNGNYSITVGAGGAGNDSGLAGNLGGFSEIALPTPIRSEGGGAGGMNYMAGSSYGGSGGGCRRGGNPGGHNHVAGPGYQGDGEPTTPSPVTPQGNAGGAGYSNGAASGGGGGGGAGGAGGNAGSNTGGLGGAGLTNSWLTGSAQFYAAGGGGTGFSGGGKSGGSGVGGDGSSTGGAGTVNTGSGGGGGWAPGPADNGGDGGPGIVLVRYLSAGGADAPFSSTGGIVYTPGNGYKYHVFRSPNTASATDLVVQAGTADLEVLMVAGGGGSGPGYAAGGGGGGVVWHESFPVSPGTYSVSVGNGGVGPSGQGQDSTFGGMTAKGGGYGGRYSTQGGNPGGSGGGAEGTEQPSGTATQPLQNTPFTPDPNFHQYGNRGGYGTTGGAYSAAGGGGAGGSAPPAGPGPGYGGPGGPGRAFPGFEYPLVGLSPYTGTAEVNSPTNNHYGAGGGGWGYSAQPNYPVGGGGRGGSTGNKEGKDGLGGGAGAPAVATVSGGDGIVIVRYSI